VTQGNEPCLPDDPAFRVAFDAAPADVMAMADLKEFDALDF
jgi:hypothetical protein